MRRRRFMFVVGTRGLSFAWRWPQVKVERSVDWVVNIGFEDVPSDG